MGSLFLQKSETNTATYINNVLDVLSKVLKNRIATENEFRKLDYPFKYLCYEKKFLSNDEIRIGNEYLKWKYPTNSVLWIDSNIIELFSNTDIIENVGNPEPKSPDRKIDLIENSSTIIKDDEQYLHWKYDCKMLSKQLVSFAGMTNENGWEPKLFLLDSMNNANRECTHAYSTTVPTPDDKSTATKKSFTDP